MAAPRAPDWLSVLPKAVQGVVCGSCHAPGARWGRTQAGAVEPWCGLCVFYTALPEADRGELLAAVEARLGVQPRGPDGKVTLALADRLVGAVALVTRLEVRSRGG